MAESRYAKMTIVYSGAEVTGKVREYLRSASYTDAANGESDSISLEFEDRDQKWIGSWRPEKGDRMAANIRTYNWIEEGDKYNFYCGNFLIDDFSAKGFPRIVNVGGVSVPQNDNFRSENVTKTWTAMGLQQIAADIAGRAGVQLVYDAADIRIDSVEQNNRPDCTFLKELCNTYGYSMKIHSEKLIIYDTEAYERKKEICSIDETDMISYEYNDTIQGSYTGAVMSFMDPNNEAEYEVQIGTQERMCEINKTADSLADAEKKGIAALNMENRKITTMTVTIMARPGLAATSCVEVTGMKSMDGKYFIDKIRHSLGASGKYTMILTMHRVIPWIKTVSVATVEAAKTEGTRDEYYEVQPGDTLWDIAARKLGKGSLYVQIYNDNKDIIEETAKKHGKASSDNGHWIWPGEVLILHNVAG